MKAIEMGRMRVALGLAAVALLAGCAKKGPLLYPDQLLPAAPLTVLDQTGTRLRLTMTVPSRDRTGRPLREPVTALFVHRKTFCADCSDTFHQVFRQEFSQPAAGEQISWIDTDVRPGPYRYQYRIGTLGEGNAAGAMLDTTAVALQTPPTPPAVVAHSAFGGVVALTFTGSVPEGTTPVGVRLYRAAIDGPDTALKLVAPLLTDVRYTDQNVLRGMQYRYAARLVVRHTATGGYLESELSPLVTVKVQDIP